MSKLEVSQDDWIISGLGLTAWREILYRYEAVGIMLVFRKKGRISSNTYGRLCRTDLLKLMVRVFLLMFSLMMRMSEHVIYQPVAA